MANKNVYFTVIPIYSSLYGQIQPLFSSSSAKLLPCCSCSIPSLQLISYFCKVMLFKHYFFSLLGLCVRSEPPLLPPQTTQRFWDAGAQREVVGESGAARAEGWRENFQTSRRSFRKLCAMMERTVMRKCTLGCHWSCDWK